MTHLRPLVFGILMGLVALVAGGAGCSMLSNPKSGDSAETEATIADVDSLDVPDAIASSDTLRIRFHGTVGPNGCYSFDRFDVEQSKRKLTITPVVQHPTAENVGCTAAIVPLDRTFTAAPPFSEGQLTFVVAQPNGEEIWTVLEVTESQG
jgi:hypothetical protein